MANLSGLGDDIKGQLQTLLPDSPKKAAKDIVQKTVESLGEQTGISKVTGHGQEVSAQQQKALEQKQTEDIVQSLYAPTEKKNRKAGGLKDQLGLGEKTNTTVSFNDQLGFKNNEHTVGLQDQLMVTGGKQKSPQEQQKLASLRQELHKETYYDPLVARAKPVTEAEQQEDAEKREKAADRMERLDFEDEKKKREKEQKMQRNQALEESKSPEKRMGTAG